MKHILMISSALSVFLLSACSSTPIQHTTVIQKANNHYEVIGLGKSNIISKNNAVNAANKSCGKLATIVIDEKTTYNGVLQGVIAPQTGKLIQAATSVLGKLSGTKTDISNDDDYQTTLTFQCK